MRVRDRVEQLAIGDTLFFKDETDLRTVISRYYNPAKRLGYTVVFWKTGKGVYMQRTEKEKARKKIAEPVILRSLPLTSAKRSSKSAVYRLVIAKMEIGDAFQVPVEDMPLLRIIVNHDFPEWEFTIRKSADKGIIWRIDPDMDEIQQIADKMAETIYKVEENEE